jgi:hypothetical protein
MTPGPVDSRLGSLDLRLLPLALGTWSAALTTILTNAQTGLALAIPAFLLGTALLLAPTRRHAPSGGFGWPSTRPGRPGPAPVFPTPKAAPTGQPTPEVPIGLPSSSSLRPSSTPIGLPGQANPPRLTPFPWERDTSASADGRAEPAGWLPFPSPGAAMPRRVRATQRSQHDGCRFGRMRIRRLAAAGQGRCRLCLGRTCPWMAGVTRQGRQTVRRFLRRRIRRRGWCRYCRSVMDPWVVGSGGRGRLVWCRDGPGEWRGRGGGGGFWLPLCWAWFARG